MHENFLHYLWQFQYFDNSRLLTTDGEPVQVLRPGMPNADSGADFLDASVLINGVKWFGNVEIHLQGSDWAAHRHQKDAAYNNVVLHVVWKNNHARACHHDGSPIPTLELHDKTNPLLIEKYLLLSGSRQDIACASYFPKIKPIVFTSMLESALMQRLERKAGDVLRLLQANCGDWEETAYQLLAQNMGFKLNNEPFLRLSRAVPVKLLSKHSDAVLQVEALLLGQAGFLDGEAEDEYTGELQREYKFLAHKYNLLPSKMEKHHWQFLRLRPVNFPTVRMMQLAALICRHRMLFPLLIEMQDYRELASRLDVCQSAYWKKHYQPGKAASGEISGLGMSSIQNILVNTVVPLLICYGHQKDQQLYTDRAIEWLEQLPPEDNKIIKKWKTAGLELQSAFDAQGSLELYNNFCLHRKCLSCRIGNSVISHQ